jgi:hypothetical protein
MAIAPAYRMAKELPSERAALPVLKVLYRNTTRIQAFGGRKNEVLRQIAPDTAAARGGSEALREAVHRRDVPGSEGLFAAMAQGTPEAAFNALLPVVHDNTEVHRVVLPYRAWDLLEVVGRDHAHTLLRQSVRYCLKAETWPRSATWDEPRTLLPKVLDEHHLLGKEPGTKSVDDARLDELSRALFAASPVQAANLAAAALAEGLAPDAIGEAISLTACELALRDHGRPPSEESPGKPTGSVHGDSIGVHASDSANAWRNMARVSSARNTFATLILGAYQVALDRAARGGDFLSWEPLPPKWHLSRLTTTDPAALLSELETAIRGNLQSFACAAVRRYGDLGLPARPVFDLLLRYAISEDGSLHAEKYYGTVSQEFAATRPAFRWRHLVALARVTASEYGRPAPGYAEACRLLKV